ncbi:MAG: hypothetical protein WCO60_13520 [Verrucomicrobiota bacterium]
MHFNSRFRAAIRHSLIVSIALVQAVLLPMASAVSHSNGTAAMLEWESSPSRSLYLYKDTTANEPRFLPTSNMTEIKAGERWYVETNSYGLMAYMSGVRLENPSLKTYGANLLEFAIQHQQDDGEFPEKHDIHHSAAFYYEATARFLMMCREPGFAEGVSSQTIEHLRNGLRKGVIWFGKETSWNDRFWRDNMHHRFLLNASVIFLAQKVLGDLPEDTLAQAYRWLQIAIDRQLPDGAMTELGGPDTGYQALGITFATGILMAGVLPEPMQNRVELLVKKGADWLTGMISVEGRIDDSANTRNGGRGNEMNRTDGKPKGVKPYEHAFALEGAGLYFNESPYLEAADRIMLAYHP